MSEWEGGRRGQGQVVQSFGGCREALGSYPKGGGSPGEQWTEEGWDLAQVLMGALWLLQGGQTAGGGRVGAGDSAEQRKVALL